MSRIRLLLVEDDPAVCKLLETLLGDFELKAARRISEAEEILASWRPDLLLLDWMLPGKSGIEWARELRNRPAWCHLPIVMLTARGEEEDKLEGLELADDYITKPFSVRELRARIAAVLRRSGQGTQTVPKRIGPFLHDAARREIRYRGAPLQLTPTEYRLLAFLLDHPDRVWTRQQLLDAVWGETAVLDERTVDVTVRRLRHALKPAGADRLVETVRGFGYRLALEREPL